jgi:beta-galactosidase
MENLTNGKSRREFLRNVALGGAAVGLYGWSGGKASAQTAGSIPLPAAQAASSSNRQNFPLNAKWQFTKEPAEDSATSSVTTTPAQAAGDFDDHAWETVGVPHCYNDFDTYQNVNHSLTYQGNAWYRNHFKLDASAQGKKLFLEFLAADIATAVYVNGKFKPGNTTVPQPGQLTHVGDFLPFVLDVTDDLRPGADNVIAVRVSNISETKGYLFEPQPPDFVGKSFFSEPGFGTKLDFGMGFGGIVGPVSLYATSKVHVPSNSYSLLQKWGTYIGTVSATTDTAKIRLQTNVENEDTGDTEVTLATRVLDATGKVVLDLPGQSQSIKAGQISLFDQTFDLSHPRLWYPNNSPHGTPYLYRVVSDVKVNGTTVDSVESPLGIRMITWDDDYCFVNGQKQILNGFGHRNMYPALGSAVPADLQWKDIKLLAECGGNLLRVGHVPALVEMIKACDAYGVLVLLNSGDNEWALAGQPAMTYKHEYDRDMIIRFRNHPSIAVWESNNGLAQSTPRYSPKETIALAQQWDFIQPRIIGSRDTSDYFPTDQKIMIGYTNTYKKVQGSPSINWEAYFGNWAQTPAGLAPSFIYARFDYGSEKAVVDHWVTDYQNNLKDQACGWINWMLAETQGEGFLTYLNGIGHQKSLGSSVLDGNRFPKLPYHVYKNALWIPFSIRPGVTLQSHWNLSGQQDVDAWTNCPKAELFLNGVSKGIAFPDDKFRCTWKDIEWQSGTLKVVGLDDLGNKLCSDIRRTAGPAHHIVLTVEPPLTKPSGETFKLMANGSDAAIITAQIVDSRGVWCPTADNNIRFTVSGPGNYRGSYNFYITPDKPLNYHAPGDPELQAEGGLMRVAVRSKFEPGEVQVKAESDGLGSGDASFTVEPLTA